MDTDMGPIVLLYSILYHQEMNRKLAWCHHHRIRIQEMTTSKDELNYLDMLSDHLGRCVFLDKFYLCIYQSCFSLGEGTSRERHSCSLGLKATIATIFLYFKCQWTILKVESWNSTGSRSERNTLNIKWHIVALLKFLSIDMLTVYR